MPKIGKIRFVNFTYNENRHIYDQTFDFFNGEDTLLNLQNGGGKTVLVQMMMQPVIPQQKLKDRLFKSYFMNAKAPGYIMIEWILDGSSKRVMTGIGIKRVLGKSIEDESVNIKVVTFLSEYEEGSSYDIKNIPLTTMEHGMVKLIEFDKVVKDLSEAEKEGNKVWLFRQNLTDDKREYVRKLTEYKINPTEWRNLMVKINEAEAGLNSFFNDCKTNKALVKKWFIPTIEEQLNKNGDFIENIRELIKNHAKQLVKNEDMMKEREIFLDFKRKSGDILNNLQDYLKLLEKSEDNKSDLGGAYQFVETAITRLCLEADETNRQMKQVEETIRGLDYQRLSSEYYDIEDDLGSLSWDVSNIRKEFADKKEELREQEYKKNLLTCARLKDELTNINARVAKFEAEFEKESLQQEDINHRINDIRYSLKLKYQDRLSERTGILENEKIKLSEEKDKLTGYLANMTKRNRDITSLQEQLIGIRGRISVFLESKAALQIMYPDFCPAADMVTGGYGTDCFDDLKVLLSEEEDMIEKGLQTLMEEREKGKERLSFVEKECRELRDKHPFLMIDKNEKESSYQVFQKEKQAIEKILHSHQLKDELLFDKIKILNPLVSDKEKYQKLMNDLNLQNSIYEKQLKQYESGKAFELPDDLKKIFDDCNIFVEFGHEWLKNLPDQKKAKLKLVKENPFLPYSLIVSEKDFELMKGLELKGILSPVIPVIAREKLEGAFMKRDGNHVYALGDIHFLIAFDDRVLNKNYLKELCDEVSGKIIKNREVMGHAQESLSHILEDIGKVEDFSYSQHDEEMFLKEIEATKGRMEDNRLKIAADEAELLSLKQRDMDNLAVKGDLEQKKHIFIRKREDILSFIHKCGQYSKDLIDKSVREDALKRETNLLEALEGDITKAKSDINEKEFKIMGLASVLEKDELLYKKYADADSGNIMEGEIESLESKLTAYTLKSSGKLQSLQDILEDYRRQRDDKQKEIGRYGIEEDCYAGMEYSSFEYEKLNDDSVRISNRIDELANAENEQQLKVAEKTSDLKYRKKSLTELCGHHEPLPRDAIKVLDYVQEKEQQKVRFIELSKKISDVKNQEHKMQRIKLLLSEYRDFLSSAKEAWEIEGDVEEKVLHLIKEHKKYTAEVSGQKSRIAAQYTELESDFTKRAELFKSLFHSILTGERKFQPAHALNAFQRVFMQIDRKLEQYSIDVKKIDDMEQYIIDNTLSYLKNVYDEMNQIDRNSTIDFDGKRCKMLIISLPDPDSLETISLKEYLRGTIANCVDLYKTGKSLDGLLENEIDTFHLFDRLVGINKVLIHLMKIEPNRLKKKTWSQVIAENSGGELFVSAFVVFISLLTYMRGDGMFSSDMESKVLIMDNPFGPITSEHLLKPLFEISKKYNTQMICLTDVKGHAIYDRFNLIYSLNIEREVGREDEYIELKTIKKDVPEKEDEILSASMFKIEDKSRFELA